MDMTDTTATTQTMGAHLSELREPSDEYDPNIVDHLHTPQGYHRMWSLYITCNHMTCTLAFVDKRLCSNQDPHNVSD